MQRWKSPTALVNFFSSALVSSACPTEAPHQNNPSNRLTTPPSPPFRIGCTRQWSYFGSGRAWFTSRRRSGDCTESHHVHQLTPYAETSLNWGSSSKSLVFNHSTSSGGRQVDGAKRSCGISQSPVYVVLDAIHRRYRDHAWSRSDHACATSIPCKVPCMVPVVPCMASR